MYKTIILDATSMGSGLATTSLTVSHTNAGNLLVVGVSAGASDIVTSVTYNGVPMSRIPTNGVVNNGNSTAYMYYLLSPSIGTFNIVVTTSVSASIIAEGISFKNVANSPPEVTTSNIASATNSCTNTLTTITDNAVHLSAFAVDAFGLSSVTNGTLISQTLAYSNPLLVTPPASHTMTGNSAGGNNAWATVGASFAPALVDSGAAFFFML